MTPFTQSQRVKSVVLAIAIPFTGDHSSNYLVQLPITILVSTRRRARLVFLLFFSRGLTVRIFTGAPLARRIIFAVMILRCWCHMWFHQLVLYGRWQVLPRWRTLIHLSPYRRRQLYDTVLGRNRLMSMCFNRLRQNRRWWLAPETASTLFGEYPAIPLPFLHCVLAKPRALWPGTGWKLRWWIIA